MSAGDFASQTYRATYSTTASHPIRVQVETSAASIGSIQNSGDTAPPTSPISARVNGNRRTLGLIARRVRIRLTGTAPTGYSVGSTTSIPALNQNFFNAATRGVTVTYLGTQWAVVGTTPEYVN